MLRKNPDYRRVKAGGRGLMGASSYWLGRDHLLVVSHGGYVESYRRFLFADIQALVVRKNRARQMGNVVCGVVAGLFALSGLVSLGSSPVGGGILLGVAGLAGVVGLINTLRGPTCVCHLRTAVQQSALPHLTRWRQAQALLAALSPLVLQAQGPWEPPAASVEPVSANPSVVEVAEANGGSPGIES